MTKPSQARRSRIRFTWTLALLILLGGCFSHFRPSRDPKRKLNPDEIVGVWHLTDETMEFFKKMELMDLNVDNSITFFSSGDCNFVSYGQVAERFIITKGKWRLQYGDCSASRGKKINTVWIELEGRNANGNPPIETLYATAHRGKIRLWFYWGDPDDSRFIEYEKESR